MNLLPDTHAEFVSWSHLTSYHKIDSGAFSLETCKVHPRQSCYLHQELNEPVNNQHCQGWRGLFYYPWFFLYGHLYNSYMDGQMEYRWSLSMYIRTVYVCIMWRDSYRCLCAHWCIPHSLLSCSLTALFKYMGTGFYTLLNLYSFCPKPCCEDNCQLCDNHPGTWRAQNKLTCIFLNCQIIFGFITDSCNK